jgi:hypothetical protein
MTSTPVNSMNGPASWMGDNSASWNWASMLNPELTKNGTKNGISRSKIGFRKYGRTNAPPFSIPLLFDPVPFSVPFPFIPGKTKTDEKKYGIRLRTELDLSRPFSTLHMGTKSMFGSKCYTLATHPNRSANEWY